MKKLLTVFLCLICLFGCVGLFGCSKDSGQNEDCVRIHIRANSNLEDDQKVKMQVVEKVVNYLTPLLAECGDVADAKSVIADNLVGIEAAANTELEKQNKTYRASASLRVESFPTRQYVDYVFPSGEYQALIIELGEGDGNNWWCVAYPPLCFVPTDNGQNFKYKSKIVEIIEKYFGGDNDEIS